MLRDLRFCWLYVVNFFLFLFVGLPIYVAIQINDGYMESGVLFYAFDIDFSLLSVPL